MSSARTKVFLLLAGLLAGFAYGVAAAKYRLFPWSLLQGARTAVAGWLGGDAGKGAEERADRRGLWLRMRAGGPEADEAAERLANLPYLGHYEGAPEREGVWSYDPERAYDGLNLVVSGHAAAASLQDMKGNVLHEWRRGLYEVWPGLDGIEKEPGSYDFWRRAHVYPSGELLAIFDGIGMVKLDRDSNVLWTFRGGCHHDLFVADDGEIYVLGRDVRYEHSELQLSERFLEDFVIVLGPDGTERRRVSILQAILDSDYYSLLAGIAKKGDLLHNNTIEVMDGRFAERHPLFAKGNVLLSMPTINAIAVLDMQAKKIIWALAGMWWFQHQPTVLDNGNMLLFDNRGHKGDSKVIEFDPLTQQIVWSFRSSEERPMHTYFLGSSQRLPNGNTLISDSVAGIGFEVTPDHEVVWEWVNPNRSGDDNELIASLLEVVRIERGYFTPEFTATFAKREAGDESVDTSDVDELVKKLGGQGQG